ncbi:MAG TPA: UDP-N-acetylmuramoyl-L-alanine--D-glutamate ligase [Candidatus Saccharimonadales bacterium]|nr:UDP-N-acetylmuramoyl-L-alanine--D-glutamate ligase [Candidatus Saccharimonadales bacterium]
MKIAIAGYGLEGKSNYAYFASQGDVTIVDERESIDDLPSGVPTILGESAFEKLSDFDLVVRTASLAPDKIKTNGKVWSATNEFFAKCSGTIIGVTGSKGKGTTCSLIANILREADQTVHLIGNIGVPALDVLDKVKPEDIIVYELSSFQLWDLEKSPAVAVVLMIEPDHLDIHADFEEYIAAKSNIRRYQTAKDICFYHPTNKFSRQIADMNEYPNAHPYNDPTDDMSVYVEEGDFVEDNCVICPLDALQLPGKHNIDNACAAINAAMSGFGADRDAVERGLRAFHGLDHRLKFVRELEGRLYYDDSIATTPGSAVAAIKAFEQPKVVILGGSSKGATFEEVAKAADGNNVRCAILIGDEANKIEQEFSLTNVPTVNLGSGVTMNQIVKAARDQSQEGDVVILSPACASFGMFKSYSDRGDQFIAAVEAL